MRTYWLVTTGGGILSSLAPGTGDVERVDWIPVESLLLLPTGEKAGFIEGVLEREGVPEALRLLV